MHKVDKAGPELLLYHGSELGGEGVLAFNSAGFKSFDFVQVCNVFWLSSSPHYYPSPPPTPTEPFLLLKPPLIFMSICLLVLFIVAP